MDMKNRCVVTGGGSGGHIAPVRAIGKELAKTHQVIWLGSADFEKNAAKSLSFEFKEIYSGKMRRGLSFSNLRKNIWDVFRVEAGFWQSLFFMRKRRPKFVFSTGGFVSVPVVVAAWFLKIPVYIHEQTIGFGLANKIGAIFAKKILLAFPDSQKYISKKYHEKISFVGNPVRPELYSGDKKKILKDFSFDASKPILYITGGGQGSKKINDVIFKNIDALCSKFFIIHQTGSTGIVESQSIKNPSYVAREFINEEMADILSAADLGLARAGAGTVNEFYHFDIYSIFIPLRPVQNDEQMKNAKWFIAQKPGVIVKQKDFDIEELLRELESFRSLWGGGKKKNIIKNGSVEKILEELSY